MLLFNEQVAKGVAAICAENDLLYTKQEKLCKEITELQAEVCELRVLKRQHANQVATITSLLAERQQPTEAQQIVLPQNAIKIDGWASGFVGNPDLRWMTPAATEQDYGRQLCIYNRPRSAIRNKCKVYVVLEEDK